VNAYFGYKIGGGGTNFVADIRVVLAIESMILSSGVLYPLSFGTESTLKPNMTGMDLLRKK